MSAEHFSIRNKTSRVARDIPFKRMKDGVLGPSYELSVALISAREARALTRRMKKKNKASNVLAFPLGKDSGEIVLCPATARREAARYGMPPRDFLAYLFIHGMLHLKGRRHGATMEHEERRILKRYGFHSQ